MQRLLVVDHAERPVEPFFEIVGGRFVPRMHNVQRGFPGLQFDLLALVALEQSVERPKPDVDLLLDRRAD